MKNLVTEEFIPTEEVQFSLQRVKIKVQVNMKNSQKHDILAKKTCLIEYYM